MMKILKNMFITITAVLVTFVAPASTYALTESQLDFYAQNNILFYDPGDGCVASFNLGNIEASGEFNENAIYIMAYLIDMGYSGEAVAGVLGNLKGEGSAFNPGEAENGYADDINSSSFRITSDWVCYGRCGFGIAQWTTAGRQSNSHENISMDEYKNHFTVTIVETSYKKYTEHP